MPGQKTQVLAFLILSGDEIGEESTATLCDFIRYMNDASRNPGLRPLTLDLSRNAFTDDAACTLAEAIAESSISGLDISGNALTLTGIRTVVDVISSSPLFRHLHVRSPDIADGDCGDDEERQSLLEHITRVAH